MQRQKQTFLKKSQKKSKKGLQFEIPFAIITYVAGRHGGAQMNMGAFPSGQWGQTVNLLLNASVVRIHQLPPKRTRNLGCGFFFCAGTGRIRTGRPSADGKKQSCGLFFRLRLANPPAPTKKLWQEYCRSFFSVVYRAKSAKTITDFQSAFYRNVQPLPGGWIFCCPLFLLLSECSISPQPETVERFMSIP